MTPHPRIASLVPSLTELAAHLGLAPFLVARTGYCIHPAKDLHQVPKVGGTKGVNIDKLRRLAPTHVLVNIDENTLETVRAIELWRDIPAPQIIVTHPCSPHDNLALVDQMLASFGALPGVAPRAKSLRLQLEHELALTRPPSANRRRQVLYLIWRNPWMTVARDTYISRMLAQVGWHSLPEQDGGAVGAARYPRLSGDEAWLGAVDDVLLSSEPYAFGANDLQAAAALCPGARVQLVDGELLSWYGPRAVPGLQYLRTLAASALEPGAGATGATANP